MKIILAKYVKAATIAIVLVALFGQVLVNLGIGINYELNKNYIATHLCENRDKPCMHCNGKCYVNKQLQKENGEHGKIPARNFSNDDSFISDIPATCSFCFTPNLISPTIINVNARAYSQNYIAGIFRPPLAA